MKKKHSIFNLIIICIFVIFVVANIFVSNGEYSALENRYLQGIPKFSIRNIFNRTYMTETENYFNDQLMFRNTFIKLKTKFERLAGKKEANGVYFSKDDYIIEKPALIDEELIKKNLQSSTALAELGSYNVSLCIIPQAYEIHKDKLPMGTHSSVIPDFYQLIESNLDTSNITYLNPTETLEEHKDEYIFYRSDHHQTADGSYLIYQELDDVLDYDPLDKSEFKFENVSDSFLGTTYSKGLLAITPDTLSVYKNDANKAATVEFYGEDKTSDSLFFPEHLETKDKYSYYLDGNHAITIIKGDEENERQIALFKDSYAHSLTPFLINHFSTIHLIDMRYYQDDPIQYLAENDIDEVLFLYGTSTFMTDTSLSKVGEYVKTSPFAKYGLVKECSPVSDSYFEDAVFLGDSLTVGFQAYSGLDASFVCKTSMSVGGVFNKDDSGMNLIQKIKSKKPKKIYTLLGVNEQIAPSTIDRVISKYEKIIDALKEDNPQALIYIQSVFPVSAAKEKSGKFKNEYMYAYNDELLRLAEDKQVYFIDVYNAVADENGCLRKELTSDGIHLGPEGCKLWLNYLKTHAMVDDENQSESGSKKKQFKQGDYDLNEIAEDLKDTVSFKGDIGETQPGMLLQTHEIDSDMIVNAYGMVGGGASSEEIALLELKDSDDAETIEDLLEEYVDMRIKSFENYIPEEVPKLKSAIIYTKDNFAALVIADDLGSAKKILEKATK